MCFHVFLPNVQSEPRSVSGAECASAQSVTDTGVGSTALLSQFSYSGEMVIKKDGQAIETLYFHILPKGAQAEDVISQVENAIKTLQGAQ